MLKQVLVPFTVAPAALLLEDYDDVKKADIIGSLGRSWIKVGLLVSHKTAAGSCGVADQAKLLPQNLRKEWTTLLGDAQKRSRLLASNISMAADDPVAAIAAVKGHVDLVYVGQRDAEGYGVPAWKASVVDAASNFEICRLDCNSSSLAIRQALEAYAGTVRKGTDTSLVWKTLIAPFVRQSSKIVVVDRYAVENRGGIFRLIEEVNLTEGDKYLTVFSSSCKAAPEDLIKSLRDGLKRIAAGSLREVVLYLGNDSVFQREAHHRYIHFGNDCCFQCDTGLEVLQGGRVFRNSPYKFSPPDLDLIACESRLRQDRFTRKETFTRGDGLPVKASKASHI